MPIQLDLSGWPLVVARHIGKPTAEEHEELRRKWEQVLARNKKYGSIIDLSQAELGAMGEQKKLVEWTKQNEQSLAELCVGSATVVQNAALRSFLKTVSFLKKPIYPQEIVGTYEEAEAFVRSKLKENGL